YAAVAGLPPRHVLQVPFLTPRLSSHWVNLVTPVPRSIAVPLIDSLVHEVVCREQDILTYVPDPPEGRIVDDREHDCHADPEALWSVVTGIGGERGWYSFPLAWSVRGWLDRLVGGVGLRRGRRDPDRLHTGDALDWWRVERLEDALESGAGERLLR